MKLQSKDRRVQKFIDRHLEAPAYQWQQVTDPRARRGRRWQLAELLNAAYLGLLAATRTLRGVEALTDELGEAGRAYVPRRVPDTTLSHLFPRLATEDLRQELRGRVRMAARSKMLEPVNLPSGVASFDGKGLGALEHDAQGDAQKGERADGSPYWLSRVMRASLTSAAAKPLLDQISIGPKTNEVARFAGFFDEVCAAYGALFEIVTADAGITSKANAAHIHAANKGYVLALKDNQPELLAEATRLLLPLTSKAPAAESPWELYRGKLVQRRLFRTTEIAAYHHWDHLQQAWLVETWERTSMKAPPKRIEQRFFLTNLLPGRLSPEQILIVVRGHWGIENDCFWTLDTQWHEDSVPWCSSGHAVEILGLLRLMAYNLLQLARRRHLRAKRPDGTLEPAPAWARIFEWVRQAIRLALPILRPLDAPTTS